MGHDKDNKSQMEPFHYDLLCLRSKKSEKIVIFAQKCAIFKYLDPHTIFFLIFFLFVLVLSLCDILAKKVGKKLKHIKSYRHSMKQSVFLFPV